MSMLASASREQRKRRAEARLRTARGLVAGLLCFQVIGAPVFAEGPPAAVASGSAKPAHVPPGKAAPVQMAGDQRIQHALNRLTFGLRPGDAAMVGRIGFASWFEQQLSPAAIDDSALDARLAAFPAMTLPQQQLFERYPSPQMLKSMVQRDTPLPQDPIQHAIYADGIAFYKEAQARKAAGERGEQKPAPVAAGDGMEASSPGEANKDTPGTGAASMGQAEQAAGKSRVIQGGAPGAPAARKRAGHVDLLGGEASGYTMPGKKKASAPEIAGSMEPGQAEAAPAAANRGRARHGEQDFPEAATLEFLALPPDARVRRILALDPAQLVNFRRSLSQEELAALAHDLSPQQKEIFAALQGSPRMIGAEVLESRLERDVYSNRQLEAVMTDFWLNHFNVYLRKNQNEPYLLPAFERETIRPHALGHFEDLLVATAKSPAMLMYLDNWQSIGPDSDAAHRGARFAGFAKNPQVKQALKDRGLNENYARELMELHTIGVGCEVSKDHAAGALDPACGQGYTQADVTEVAKVFSGWTIDRPAEGAAYSFEERRHQPGSKTVLGHAIRESGEREGLEVLRALAMSPATAKFLSTKIAIRFVSDTPPAALVDRMSASYLSSGGDIRSVLRTMVNSPEFWSPAVYRAKVKTPLEFVVSALRATGAEITNAVPLVQALDRLGMPLYGMQTLNGYSWKAEPWVSTAALVSRMNFALVLSGDKLPGTRTDGSLLLGDRPVRAQPVAMHAQPIAGSAQTAPADSAGLDPAAVAEELRLEQILLGSAAGERTRHAVLTQSGDLSVPRQAEQEFLAHGAADAPRPDAGAATRQAAVMAGLLLGSPEFQRR